MSELEIKEAWAQIKGWLTEHAGDVIEKLPPGVKPNSVAKAQEQLGFEIPSELVIFLGAHDGSGQVVFHDWGYFMSLEQMLQEWDMQVDLWGDGENDGEATPPAKVRKKWFSPKWLPFVNAGTGDLLCLDMDPTKKGKAGQVIVWSHTDGPQEVLAPSLGAFLAGYLEDMKKGKYKAAKNFSGETYLEYQR